MKIAIMQPYFLSHIAYFQLIRSVDKFVFYDNVNYKKSGWINRNTLKNGESFTIPIKNQSQNKLIMNSEIKWEDKLIRKFLKKVNLLYSSYPNFKNISLILEKILSPKYRTISELAIASTIEISKYLDIKTNFKIASTQNYTQGKDRIQSLVNICKKEDAHIYINAQNGQSLYTRKDFEQYKIKLFFILSNPSYSILDACFTLDKNIIKEKLNNYSLCEAKL